MKKPALVFFSGGTALKELATELAAQNADATYLVTTFDSGGSSAELRKVFAMPAVGDLRNRLLAVSGPEASPLRDIFSTRISLQVSRGEAMKRLKLVLGKDGNIWDYISPESCLKDVREAVDFFFKNLPAVFDARGASIGNIVLAALYLVYGRNFHPALRTMSCMLHARAKVLPVTDANLHLGAILRNGEIIFGQHRFKALTSPVAAIFLTSRMEDDNCGGLGHAPACSSSLLREAESFLLAADMIVYPMGSFFSSVLANLMLHGVGGSIARNAAFKVFIPNSGIDPELCGYDLSDEIHLIRDTLLADTHGAQMADVLQYVLVDSKNGRYPGKIDQHLAEALEGMGIKLVDRPIIAPDDPQRHLPGALFHVLLEIAAGHV